MDYIDRQNVLQSVVAGDIRRKDCSIRGYEAIGRPSEVALMISNSAFQAQLLPVLPKVYAGCIDFSRDCDAIKAMAIREDSPPTAELHFEWGLVGGVVRFS